MRADPRFKPLPAEPATLLTEGRVIDAIKALRGLYPGLSLKEAKNWVDAHIAEDPMLGVQLQAQQRAARRKFFFWFLIVDALIAAAIIYYLFYLPR
jgi:hypothetical protein